MAHSISDRGENGMASPPLGVGLAKAPTQIDSISTPSAFTLGVAAPLNSPLMAVVSLPFAVLGRGGGVFRGCRVLAALSVQSFRWVCRTNARLRSWGASAAYENGCPCAADSHAPPVSMLPVC